MSPTKKISDGLITEADVEQFKDEVDKGRLGDIVYEVMQREPELAIYVSLRWQKIARSLLHSGIDGRRLSAIHSRLLITICGAMVLTHRSQRRLWEGFMPLEETTEKDGDK